MKWNLISLSVKFLILNMNCMGKYHLLFLNIWLYRGTVTMHRSKSINGILLFLNYFSTFYEPLRTIYVHLLGKVIFHFTINCPVEATRAIGFNELHRNYRQYENLHHLTTFMRYYRWVMLMLFSTFWFALYIWSICTQVFYRNFVKLTGK